MAALTHYTHHPLMPI